MVFAALVGAYPFVEQLVTGDSRHHNILLLPYQQPFNTAFGCAAFTMLLVLFFAGGDDVIAVATASSLAGIRTFLRIAFFVAPTVVGGIVYVLCRRACRRHSRAAAELPAAEMVPQEH